MAVIDALRALFATFGLPQKIASDNGTAFVSAEIRRFYKDNSTTAVTSAPHHPATNGQAKRYAAELKRALCKDETGSLQRRLARFLFKQHTTVQNTTSQTPVRLMFLREMRTPLTAVRPEPSSKAAQDARDPPRSRWIQEGERVLARQFQHKPAWVPATVKKRISLRSWLVEMFGTTTRRHLNQLCQLRPSSSKPAPSEGSCVSPPVNRSWHLTMESAAATPSTTCADGQLPSPLQPQAVDKRKSSRQRHPPDCYQALF